MDEETYVKEKMSPEINKTCNTYNTFAQIKALQ